MQRWLDDVADWCGMEVHQLTAELAQTRAAWRQNV